MYKLEQNDSECGTAGAAQLVLKTTGSIKAFVRCGRARFLSMLRPVQN